MHFSKLPLSGHIGVAASIDGLVKALEDAIDKEGRFLAPATIEGAKLTGYVYRTIKTRRPTDKEALSSSLDVAAELMRQAGLCETQYPLPAQSQRMWKRGWEIRRFKKDEEDTEPLVIVLTAWSGSNPKLHA